MAGQWWQLRGSDQAVYLAPLFEFVFDSIFLAQPSELPPHFFPGPEYTQLLSTASSTPFYSEGSPRRRPVELI